MTVREINKRVREIAQSAGDDECAHSMEDALHRDVMRAIADGAPDAASLARAALKTTKIQFHRWCA